MMVFRASACVAALVTITLNASYGYKTSTVFEYAVLFAALNAALDVAKCSCLVVAGQAWQRGQPMAALVLFVLFWPMLANSLWCGFSEVTFNRATETARHDVDSQARTLAATAHERAQATLTDLEASPHYKSSTACALPKTNREQTLCQKHAEALARLAAAATALTQDRALDPTPQLTLLASLTGIDTSALLLAAAFWPIALAELCGSVGFYLGSPSGRTKRRLPAFSDQTGHDPAPPPKTAPKPLSVSPTPSAIQWPALPP